MTKQKLTKRALLLSGLSLLMCFSMLIGSTFAWFTDSVTSAGNKIQSGTLKIDLELLDKASGQWNSIKEDQTALFNNEQWEPGYSEVKVLKVENEGTLALKWAAKFVSSEELSVLSDVIDVYVKPSAEALTYPADRNLEGYTKVGTVREFVNTIKETTNGSLKANESAYLGIAIKMRESAGNEYQDKTLGAFDIQILATQLTYESDSFDDQYDADATLEFAPVSNMNELKIALANKEENIVLTENIEAAETLNVDYDANIDGKGFAVSRADGFTETIFTVKENAALTLNYIVVDGGAVWVNTPADDAAMTNNGVAATGNLILAEANAEIILNDGAVLQNNDGAHAVNLGTRIGATLTMNGGEIVYNRSGSGAIWGGGHITLNDGKISNNMSTGIGGAVRMVSSCNLTMNGGEISGNIAATDGGAIWGYGASTYNFNGGKMENNAAGGTGGAIYTGTYSAVNISGDFELCSNKAENSGAIRFTDHASLTMNGGRVYGNTQNGVSNAFNTWNNTFNMKNGELSDNISYVGGLGFTMGEATINGVVAFDLSTNHNTVYLAETFGTIKFTVNEEDEHFSNFNFRPADGYTYTEGDEAKLICMNDGYETYWDTVTGTFRLQVR